MPFRLDEHKAKIQFVTSARTPWLVTQAAEATGAISNTAYLQRAVAEALSRDLGIPLSDLLEELPMPRGAAWCRLGPDRRPLNNLDK